MERDSENVACSNLVPSGLDKVVSSKAQCYFMAVRAEQEPNCERLLSWGLDIELLCLLCGMHSESRDHIFLECTYKLAVW